MKDQKCPDCTKNIMTASIGDFKFQICRHCGWQGDIDGVMDTVQHVGGDYDKTDSDTQYDN